MQIEIHDVCYSYPTGVKALSNVTLEISRGEKVAIVGQNGAGKTTLVKQINGLLRPSEGVVLHEGKDITELSIAHISRFVGYVFQNPDTQLFSNSVEEEVSFGPRNLVFPPEKIERMVDFALNITGIEGQRTANPYDLSASWRKMVAFASVIAMDTAIIILDEPTTGQDAVMLARMSEIIQHLAGLGKTIIAITHDIDFAAENFTRLIAMSQGAIILDGPILDVIDHDEVLATTFVEPPQITRLGKALGFMHPVTTTQAFLDELAQQRKIFQM